jgi:hypothetical protein
VGAEAAADNGVAPPAAGVGAEAALDNEAAPTGEAGAGAGARKFTGAIVTRVASARAR